LVITLFLVYLYVYNNDYLKKIDHKFYDITTTLINAVEEQSESYSVVVDIDDASLEDYGQWPWPRVLDAELIKIIDNAGSIAIGVNILFPEADRTSPSSIQQFYKTYLGVDFNLSEFPEYLRDNDKLLHDTIVNANVTLPIHLQNKLHTKQHCEEMSYKKNIFKNIKVPLSGNTLLCNDKILQEGIENFGVINASKDNDGILRRVPLFMRYKEQVFPSFALATILSFYGELETKREDETILINFTKESPKVISASNLLKGKFNPEDFKGKIVILSSSIVGLSSAYQTPLSKMLSNGMVNALLIDNILSDSFLIQPEYYKKINLTISFLLLIWLYFLLSKKHYFYLSMLLLVLIFISLITLFFNYLNGVYISLGYFWVPIILGLIVFIFYHLRVLNQEQQEQEKILIRQSKLASMGKMISLIAHQWRQPLSSINGTVLNLDIDFRNEKLDTKRFDNYLNDIEQTTAYLSETITDFREFFSHNKKSEKFDLEKVIEQAKHLSSLSKSNQVDVIYRKKAEVVIDGFSSELVQSLLVLLNNAIYICKENIATIGKGKIYIDVLTTDKKVSISVSDNGGGIPKKNIKKIFDPYFTTKDKHNGTGLGLYILKLIVEDSMNGKVWVKNGKKGAVFTIEIPKSKK
jgi:signal transduction histidine kinase